ncbi:hypothetical protein IGI04_016616 [Brassica rapa subsp. trilocularis]|uniref:AT-hook motif nuclear-localized protein n=1 Tax=Brassica rapa subsp. trilocularis TaxID=1813537 RepID=A0ABQ7MTI5_BRACM|nr:hypothetical protein IGI04_016616 [Brassica rapa subsp. trilocularis]
MELQLIRTLQCIPPGGMYGHPSIPPGNTTGGNEGDATRQSEVKEKLPIKRSRGSLGSLNIITGKNSGASANGAYSKSGKSASDGSSEGSDANSQNVISLFHYTQYFSKNIMVCCG